MVIFHKRFLLYFSFYSNSYQNETGLVCLFVDLFLIIWSCDVLQDWQGSDSEDDDDSDSGSEDEEMTGRSPEKSNPFLFVRVKFIQPYNVL